MGYCFWFSWVDCIYVTYTNMLETMGRKKVRKREALQHIPPKKEDLDLDP